MGGSCTSQERPSGAGPQQALVPGGRGCGLTVRGREAGVSFLLGQDGQRWPSGPPAWPCGAGSPHTH